MSDLIERLRLNQGKIFGPTMQEAADEIERLQRENEELTQKVAELSGKMAAFAQIKRENEELRQRLAVEEAHSDKYRCENEELRKELMDSEDDFEVQAAHNIELQRELAALKTQSAEPVAWMFQHDETGRTMCVEAQQVEWGFEKNNPHLQKICPLYTTPPTATALVEDFRKRAVEALKGLEASAKKNIDRGAVSAAEMMQAYQYAQQSIESLPLIEEK